MVLAVSLPLSAEPPAEVVTSPRLPGLHGWGLGLEVPILGVVSGFGQSSNLGVGFTFGGALDYHVSSNASVRLLIHYSETFAGEANAQFDVAAGGRDNEDFDAEYFAVQAAIGGRYAFQSDRSWAPYIGADIGLAFGGFDYNFGEDPQGLRAFDGTSAFESCEGTECRSGINDSAQTTWTAGVRGGLQFDLAAWLRSSIEISVDYLPFNAEEISNTVDVRDVTSAEEALILIRASYIARFGL